MGKIAFVLAAALTLSVFGAGCGVDEDNIGNRLIVDEVTDLSGSSALVFNAVEQTNDFGEDNQEDTFDTGENDGRPTVNETVDVPLGPDAVVLALRNDPRPGLDDGGVDIDVYQVDITYVDRFGRSRAFAPTFSPAAFITLENGESGGLEIVLVPEDMKKVQGGLRDIFLFGDPIAEGVTNMTAILDIYYRDRLNNDSDRIQTSVNITFINPMSSQAPGAGGSSSGGN